MRFLSHISTYYALSRTTVFKYDNRLGELLMVNYVSSNHKIQRTGYLLACLVVLSLVVLGGYLWRGVLHVGVTKGEAGKTAALPPDVDNVYQRYVLRDCSEGCSIEIKGRQIVKRGRLLLGLRSNLVKTGYFKGFSGVFHSKKSVTTLSADDAEWNMESSSPIILHGNIRVESNGKEYSKIRNCRVYVKRGLIELFTVRLIVLHFK